MKKKKKVEYKKLRWSAYGKGSGGEEAIHVVNGKIRWKNIEIPTKTSYESDDSSASRRVGFCSLKVRYGGDVLIILYLEE